MSIERRKTGPFTALAVASAITGCAGIPSFERTTCETTALRNAKYSNEVLVPCGGAEFEKALAAIRNAFPNRSLGGILPNLYGRGSPDQKIVILRDSPPR